MANIDGSGDDIDVLVLSHTAFAFCEDSGIDIGAMSGLIGMHGDGIRFTVLDDGSGGVRQNALAGTCTSCEFSDVGLARSGLLSVGIGR